MKETPTAKTIETLTANLSLHPEWLQGWFELSALHFSARRWADAASSLHRVVAMEPAWAKAHHYLGRCFANEGCWSEAESHANLTVALVPDWPDAHFHLGGALHSQWKWIESERTFAIVTAIQPERAPAHFYLGYARTRLGRFTEAISTLSRAVSLQPTVKNRRALHRAKALLSSIYPRDRTIAISEPHETISSTDSHLVVLIESTIDLDHLAPVIFKWTQDGTRSACAILVDAHIPDTDFRLAFIRSLPHTILVRLWQILPQDGSAPLSTAIHTVIPSDRRTVIATTHDTLEITSAACQAAAARGLKVVALPTSEWPLVNRLIYASAFSNLEQANYQHFDYMVFPHRAALEVDSGSLTSRLRPNLVLGSARYCREWLDIAQSILPRSDLPASTNRLKLVMFLISEKFAISWQEVHETIKLLMTLPNIHLLISKHPRPYVLLAQKSEAADFSFDYQSVLSNKNQNASSIIELAEAGTTGASLVAWGDVFLTISTSIAVEPIVRRKPLLEMSYLHSNYALVARELKVSDLRCRDDVLAWINTFLKTPRDRLGDVFYDEAERQAFIERYVEPLGRSPLGCYVELLESVASLAR